MCEMHTQHIQTSGRPTMQLRMASSEKAAPAYRALCAHGRYHQALTYVYLQGELPARTGGMLVRRLCV